MAFVLAHRFATTLRAGRRAVDRLRSRHHPAAQHGPGRYPSQLPVAMVTASLGGHARPLADYYR